MKLEDGKKLKVFQTLLELQENQMFHLRFGPLDLYLTKNDIELVIRWSTSNNWLDSSFHYDLPYEGLMPENLLTTQRVAFSRKISNLRVIPCLGEKPFVAHPFDRLDLLPGEKTKVFMSTPMSVQIIDTGEGEVLAEIPVFQRPLTWFGENTIRGEVCFFTNINAALSEEDLPFRPHRAMTHLHISNRSNAVIPIERLKIPVQFLSLFQKENGRFVTSSIDMDCDNKGRVRKLEVRRPRTNVKSLTAIAPPRKRESRLLLPKTVSELMR